MRYLLALALGLALAAIGATQDTPLDQFLLPGEGWKLLSVKVESIGGLTADAGGQVYIIDSDGGKIGRLGDSGESEAFAKPAGTVSQLRAGPGGLLFALKEVEAAAKKGAKASTKNLVVSYDAQGKEKVLLSGFQGTWLAVGPRTGRLYLAGTKKGGASAGVYLLNVEDGKAALSPRSLVKNSADLGSFAFSPDEGTVAAAFDPNGWVDALRVEADGSLKYMQPYWSLLARPGLSEEVSDLVFDRVGRLYAASEQGVQVFDPTGRLSGVLPYPRQPPMKPPAGAKTGKATNEAEDDDEGGPEHFLAFGGPDFDRLYLAVDNKLYVRNMKARGVPPPK